MSRQRTGVELEELGVIEVERRLSLGEDSMRVDGGLAVFRNG